MYGYRNCRSRNCDGPATVGLGSVGPGTDGPGTVGSGTDDPGTVVIPWGSSSGRPGYTWP